jgi:hypothetical protein
MRRVQIILVILSLICAPLSLLVQPASADMPGCGGMCCLPHHGSHHPMNHSPAPPKHDHSGSMCEHGGAAQMPNCAFHCGNTQAQHIYVSPVAPTKPSNLATVARLNQPKNIELKPETRGTLSGFLAEPFQPPRA